MKQILLGVFATLFCSTTVLAQHPGKKTQAPSPQQTVKRMDKVLDLSDQQEEKLLALYTDFYQKAAACKDKKERMACRTALKQQVNQVLSTEQQQKWTAHKKERAAKRKARKQQQQQ